jgi:hypothetical protein
MDKRRRSHGGNWRSPLRGLNMQRASASPDFVWEQRIARCDSRYTPESSCISCVMHSLQHQKPGSSAVASDSLLLWPRPHCRVSTFLQTSERQHQPDSAALTRDGPLCYCTLIIILLHADASPVLAKTGGLYTRLSQPICIPTLPFPSTIHIRPLGPIIIDRISRGRPRVGDSACLQGRHHLPDRHGILRALQQILHLHIDRPSQSQ